MQPADGNMETAPGLADMESEILWQSNLFRLGHTDFVPRAEFDARSHVGAMPLMGMGAVCGITCTGRMMQLRTFCSWHPHETGRTCEGPEANGAASQGDQRVSDSRPRFCSTSLLGRGGTTSYECKRKPACYKPSTLNAERSHRGACTGLVPAFRCPADETKRNATPGNGCDLSGRKRGGSDELMAPV